MWSQDEIKEQSDMTKQIYVVMYSMVFMFTFTLYSLSSSNNFFLRSWQMLKETKKNRMRKKIFLKRFVFSGKRHYTIPIPAAFFSIFSFEDEAIRVCCVRTKKYIYLIYHYTKMKINPKHYFWNIVATPTAHIIMQIRRKKMK